MPVILGPVTFTDREIPDVMPFGGKQSMAVHRNLGGKRMVDIMGPNPDPIKWQGLFFGPTASQRARLLDALKDTGAELRLSWGSFNFLVVIEHFNALYKHEWEVRYEISVIISQIAAITPYPALEQIIKSDWVAAAAVPGLPNSALQAIAAAQKLIDGIAATLPNGQLANASLSALAPAIAAAEGAYNTVDGLMAATEANILGINLDAGSGASVLDGFNSFLAEASNAATASNLRVARSYLGRIVGNLTTLGG